MSDEHVVLADNAAMSVREAAQAFEALLAEESGEQAPEKAQAETDEVEASGDVEAEAGQQGEVPEEVEASSESEESEESKQPDEPPTFTVKIDGKEEAVPLDELLKGYQRTADYTRKTQALAEQRKAAEAELNAVREERATYSQLLTALQQQLQQQQESPVDMERLYREDPIEWVRQTELARQRSEKLAASQAELQRLNTLQQQEVQRAMQARLKEEASLLVSAIPEWRDEKTAKAEKSALIEFGVKEGFTPDDLKGVVDHRVVKVLRKAMMFDQIMSKQQSIKPNVVAPKAKTVAPGNPQAAKVQVNEITRARQRLAKTGSVKDAAKLFEQFL
jgi:myosin heavy subunit